MLAANKPSAVQVFREKAFPDRWSEAMNWWRSQNLGVQTIIRQVANKLLAESIYEGNGISSSDTNHKVFDMYINWLYYKEHDNSVISFLLEAANGNA